MTQACQGARRWCAVPWEFQAWTLRFESAQVSWALQRHSAPQGLVPRGCWVTPGVQNSQGACVTPIQHCPPRARNDAKVYLAMVVMCFSPTELHKVSWYILCSTCWFNKVDRGRWCCDTTTQPLGYPGAAVHIMMGDQGLQHVAQT